MQQQSELSANQFITYNFKNIWESSFRADWKIFRKNVITKIVWF